MPNFNTHWLVARQALSATPQWIQDGANTYVKAASTFSEKVGNKIAALTTTKEAEGFSAAIANLAEKYFKGNLKKSAKDHDDATCFSAYMCGACGPDFWMLPYGKTIPDLAGEHHFDLGHYNRTHQQFFVSLERLKGADRDALPAKVEMAYFLGMATHVAADLIIHQLVNRSAGAYNLLEKNWLNEQGHNLLVTWSTHNKVEHYWDSYVRLRYLGDYGPVFEEKPEEKAGLARRLGKGIEPMNLPVIETLQRKVRTDGFKAGFLERVREDQLKAMGSMSVGAFAASSHRAQQVLQALEEVLADETTRIALERPLTFPQLFAERMLAGKTGGLKPFIYEVVIDKDNGAYPEEAVPAAITKEAKSGGMKRKGKFTEANKVEFFSASKNAGKPVLPCSNNYLTYYVCPDLERLQKFGHNVFYDLDALEPFIDRAAEQAKRFVGELWSAYQSSSTGSLRKSSIARFWNLDTGLGLRVAARPSHTSKEVITRLDFVHVLDPKSGGGSGGIDYSGAYPYLDGKRAVRWEHVKEDRAFPTCSAGPFEKLAEVREEKGKYLDRIRLAGPTGLTLSPCKIDDDIFFPKEASPLRKSLEVRTVSLKKENVIAIREMAHRLNLELRVSIARLGADKVGMFLQGDRAGVQPPCQGTAKEWLSGSPVGARMLDSAEEGKNGPADLARFTTRLLANLESSRDLKPRPDGWNNVIDYKENEKNYGRNFAIGTGRTNVLHASLAVRQNLDASKDFSVYTNVSPTEQVFFSLYALVRTAGGVFDAFSKKKVEKDEMTEIRRIQAVGFVKIVLYYELGPHSGCQLSKCYVDGLRVDVEDDWSRED